MAVSAREDQTIEIEAWAESEKSVVVTDVTGPRLLGSESRSASFREEKTNP